MSALIKTQAKVWDILLLYMEFAYNIAPHRTTGLSLFKMAYGVDLLAPRDLFLRAIREKPSLEAKQKVKEIQALHVGVIDMVEKRNASY